MTEADEDFLLIVRELERLKAQLRDGGWLPNPPALPKDVIFLHGKIKQLQEVVRIQEIELRCLRKLAYSKEENQRQLYITNPKPTLFRNVA